MGNRKISTARKLEASMTNPNFISPKDIEPALTELWDKHNDGTRTRASLFNLILYTKADYRESYLQKIAQNIISRYPCRMIIITEYEKEKEGFLKTFVTDMEPKAGDMSLFCDVINFDVTPDFRERIPFVVLPHLSPDLPVFLIWGANPTVDDALTHELEKVATRTIFDSETVSHMSCFARTLLTKHKEVLNDVGDLNWARLAAWREVMAHSFATPNRLSCLKNAKEITIHYNNEKHSHYAHTKIQAAYFQAWLACSLKWKFETSLSLKEEMRFSYTTEKGPLTVIVQPGNDSEVAPGRILSVEISSYDESHAKLYRSDDDPNKVTIVFSTKSECSLPLHFLLSKESTVKSISHEIYNQSTNQRFIQVLELIAQCKEGVICS